MRLHGHWLRRIREGGNVFLPTSLLPSFPLLYFKYCLIYFLVPEKAKLSALGLLSVSKYCMFVGGHREGCCTGGTQAGLVRVLTKPGNKNSLEQRMVSEFTRPFKTCCNPKGSLVEEERRRYGSRQPLVHFSLEAYRCMILFCFFERFYLFT